MEHSRILKVCFFMVLSSILCASFVDADDVREDCSLCGMWIDQYMHTRHVLTMTDGTRVSFCSFTCAAKFLKNKESEVKRIEVADYLSAELVDVKSAFYLAGSDAPPVMSYISVIAFARRQQAEIFQKLNGGKIMTFEEALAMQ